MLKLKKEYKNIDLQGIALSRLDKIIVEHTEEKEFLNALKNRVGEEIKYLKEADILDYLKLCYILKQKANEDKRVLYMGLKLTNTFITPYLLQLDINRPIDYYKYTKVLQQMKLTDFTYRTIVTEDSYIDEITKYVEEVIENKVQYEKGVFEGTNKKPVLMKIEDRENITFIDVFFDLESIV